MDSYTREKIEGLKLFNEILNCFNVIYSAVNIDSEILTSSGFLTEMNYISKSEVSDRDDKVFGKEVSDLGSCDSQKKFEW